MELKIESVRVEGSGADPWLAALVVKRLLPALRVVVAEEKAVPLPGEATTPFLARELLGTLGIRPIDLHTFARPVWSLGFRCRWGVRTEFFRAHDLQLTQRGGGLAREAAYIAAGEGLDGASPGQVMMKARRVPPVDRRQGSGALDATAGLQLEPSRFADMLRRACAVVGVETDGDAADLTLRTQGMPDGDFLEAPVFCPRMVTASRPRASEAIRPYAGLETHESGWWRRIDHADRVEFTFFHDPSFVDDETACGILAGRLGDGAGAPARIERRCGRLAEPWRGNMLAVGDAAGVFEPIGGMRLPLLYHEVRTFCRLVGEAKQAPGAACRALYNGAIGRARAEISDFATLHYEHSGRDEAFWTAARERVRYEAAGPLLALYRKTGPSGYILNALPSFPGVMGGETWIAALVGLGVPFEAGAGVSAEEKEWWRSHVEEQRRRVSKAVEPERALAAARGA